MKKKFLKEKQFLDTLIEMMVCEAKKIDKAKTKSEKLKIKDRLVLIHNIKEEFIYWSIKNKKKVK